MTRQPGRSKNTRATPPKRERVAQGAAFALDTFLPYRLATLAAQVSRGLGEVYGDRFGLTISEWRVIANLGHAGPLYAGELAERSSMDKPKVTRALQRLEVAGLLVRAIDVEDRRQARLSLTEKGRALFAEVAGVAKAWETQLVEVLDPNEIAVLDASIEKLHARASALRGAYSDGKTAKTIHEAFAPDKLPSPKSRRSP